MRKFIPVVVSIAVANPTLYLVAVGLAPALLATAAIQTAMDETVFTTIQGFKWGKVFYAMNATPLSGRQIANGVFLSSFLRAAFSTVVYGVVIDLFGGFSSARGWFAVLVGLLAGSAFGALMLGVSAWIRNDDQFFNILGRFIMMPLFLFSGTFYQLSTLPIYLRWVGWASPIWHATELGRYMTYGHHISVVMFIVHFGYLIAMLAFGMWLAYREFEKRWMAFKNSAWIAVLSGFFEPVLYLLSFGYGLGHLIGTITLPGGRVVSYAMFIAPGLLATSAMNGAIYDSTWNVFFKLKFDRIYQGMLQTSLGSVDVALGEIGWALIRGLAYTVGFMCIAVPAGLIPSWWGILAIPAAVLIAFGFASIGMAITSCFTTFQQMDFVNIVMLPLFLFSGSFYPLTVYPGYLQAILKASPLWQAIEMVRDLTLGVVLPQHQSD
eukprot:gene5385-5437_t